MTKSVYEDDVNANIHSIDEKSTFPSAILTVSINNRAVMLNFDLEFSVKAGFQTKSRK